MTDGQVFMAVLLTFVYTAWFGMLWAEKRGWVGGSVSWTGTERERRAVTRRSR